MGSDPGWLTRGDPDGFRFGTRSGDLFTPIGLNGFPPQVHGFHAYPLHGDYPQIPKYIGPHGIHQISAHIEELQIGVRYGSNLGSIQDGSPGGDPDGGQIWDPFWAWDLGLLADWLIAHRTWIPCISPTWGLSTDPQAHTGSWH